MSKCVLRGGPWEGKVIDVKRNDFGTGMVFEVFDKQNKFLGRSPTYYYEGSFLDKERHPCKKKGTTQVWRYQGPNMEKAILPEKLSDRVLLRPENFEDLKLEEKWEIDKALGILDWDGE